MDKACLKCGQLFSGKPSRQFCGKSCAASFTGKGKKQSLETKLRRAESHRGMKRSAETCVRISSSKTGKKVPALQGSRNPNWNPDRNLINLRKRMKKMCFAFLGRTFSKIQREKESTTYDVLGYTPNELKIHLENMFAPGMSWENYGRGIGKWNVDHIRPIASFPNDSDFQIVNALENLQPLWAVENSKKGAKFNG